MVFFLICNIKLFLLLQIVHFYLLDYVPKLLLIEIMGATIFPKVEVNENAHSFAS